MRFVPAAARLLIEGYDFVSQESQRRGSDVFRVLLGTVTCMRGPSLPFARMRAIETGRAVVNVSSVGTCEIVGSDGAVVDAVGDDWAAARVTTVPVRTGLTPAFILGPWIAGIVGLGSLLTAGLVVGYRRSRQPDMVRNQVAR